MDESYVLNELGFQNFVLLYENFYKIMTMIWKKNTFIILMFYPFESTKNPSTIVLSSYFHIFETWVWHLLSCTCISKNVPKCILIHAIIQYYAMKSKIFLLLIIKVKYIHDFNVLNLSLWILSTTKRSNIHGHTLPCFHPFEIAMLLKKDKI